MKKLIALVLIIFTVHSMLSQGPPITVETPIMLGLQGTGIRTFGKFISKEQSSIYVQVIGIPYNVSAKF